MYGPSHTAVRIALCSIAAATLPFAASPAHAAESRAGSVACAHRYDAIRALDAQRYAGAFACFSALATRGDAKAAQMALALVRYRPSVSDVDWSATPAQQQYWQQLVGADNDFDSALTAADGAD